VIRLRKSDDSLNYWNKRNPRKDPNRKPGPYDPQRYNGGYPFTGFPTFFRMPIAMTSEDLKAGDIDVAIVGSTTDMNVVHGTSWAANMLRGHPMASSTYYVAKGDGKQTRERDIMPVDQYVRSSLHELNIVDFGNIMRHPYSGEKSTEEIRKVLGEIFDGGAMPMMVGGAHDNMLGLFLAVADKYGRENFGIIHFDSHADTIMDGYGFYVHNANGIAMGEHLGLYKGEDIIQVGLTSVGPDDSLLKWAKDRKVRYYMQAEIEKDGWETVMRRVLADVKDIENLVITADIDIMAQAFVPGTGGREPDGPAPKEMMKMMRALAIQNNVVAIEICEYNPLLDSQAFETAIVVRHLMLHFMYGKAARMRGIEDPFYYHPDMINDGVGAPR
jgi:agmatinase